MDQMWTGAAARNSAALQRTRDMSVMFLGGGCRPELSGKRREKLQIKAQPQSFLGETNGGNCPTAKHCREVGKFPSKVCRDEERTVVFYFVEGRLETGFVPVSMHTVVSSSRHVHHFQSSNLNFILRNHFMRCFEIVCYCMDGRYAIYSSSRFVP